LVIKKHSIRCDARTKRQVDRGGDGSNVTFFVNDTQMSRSTAGLGIGFILSGRL